ncbi:MAG TPA: hypothetical protein PKE55_10035 [Kiritimatiellia bacterium]|nr:hypothetical protein [Kiritimatiellia bacterium]
MVSRFAAHRALNQLASAWLPRILTQIDRDPTSSSYGCADRNWWHYKIRDFPSIILQQAGYSVWLAGNTPGLIVDGLEPLAAASCRFWASRAIRYGAFEEYYPWERGYPPLAFSTLAVMKMVTAGVVEPSEIEMGARVAAEQLLHRFEGEAANQQVAGLAALWVLRSVFPKLVSREDCMQCTRSTLALQHDEGWYWEYGGPDLGYLSVTVDCLFDALDAGGDSKLRASAESAVRYLDQLTRTTRTNIGMHNSRNTDYLVPYGIARLAGEGMPEAASLVDRLFQHADRPDHFFASTDDRYLCHYIGHSVIRAAQVLLATTPQHAPAHEVEGPIYFEGSGHLISSHALISLRKGGIATVVDEEGGQVSDFGWRVFFKGEHWVTHWWSDHWEVHRLSDARWEVKGNWVPCRERLSHPFHHHILRLASLVMGQSIIGWLKRRLIFARRLAPAQFFRRLTLVEGGLDIEDRMEGLPAGICPEVAPRASKRHVASADSWHPADVHATGCGERVTRTLVYEGGTWIARTQLRSAPLDQGATS